MDTRACLWYNMGGRGGMTVSDMYDIEKALNAADFAMACLCDAQSRLSEARSWGIADILGGGLVTTAVKREKMSAARECIVSAKLALEQFRGTLGRVELPDRLDDSKFLRLADYWLDGGIADLLVQRRIKEAQRSVDDAIIQVDRIRQRLKRLT